MKSRPKKLLLGEPYVILMSPTGIPEFIATDCPTHICTAKGWKNMINPNHPMSSFQGSQDHMRPVVAAPRPPPLPPLARPPPLPLVGASTRPVSPELNKSAVAESDFALSFDLSSDIWDFSLTDESNAWTGYDSLDFEI
jgi:hypothetical protein